jgi:hypothetical protein
MQVNKTKSKRGEKTEEKRDGIEREIKSSD